jgi:hypothetical protein
VGVGVGVRVGVGVIVGVGLLVGDGEGVAVGGREAGSALFSRAVDVNVGRGRLAATAVEGDVGVAPVWLCPPRAKATSRLPPTIRSRSRPASPHRRRTRIVS